MWRERVGLVPRNQHRLINSTKGEAVGSGQWEAGSMLHTLFKWQAASSNSQRAATAREQLDLVVGSACPPVLVVVAGVAGVASVGVAN